MAGKKKRGEAKGTPGYLRHRDDKRGDRAFVLLNGKRIYLGKYGTDKSREAYDRTIAEWLARGRKAPVEKSDATLMVHVIAAFWTRSVAYYRRSDGTPTGEAEKNLKPALKPLRQLYGDLPTDEFGTAQLKALQAHFVEAGLARTTVNKRISGIRRCIKWGEAEGLIPKGTFHNLGTVEGLKASRTQARETEEVKPVAWQDVRATLDHLAPTISAMVQLQWETAMRPGEVAEMRLSEIDRTEDDVWYYCPVQHKNAHRQKTRTVRLFERSQAVLAPFIETITDSSDYLFRPQGHRASRKCYSTSGYAQAISRGIAAANASSRQDAVIAAIYAMLPEEAHGRVNRAIRRLVTNLNEERISVVIKRLAARFEFDVTSAIETACAALHEHDDPVPHWTPNMLRHSGATRIARELGPETAQHALDHASLRTTKIYLDPDERAITEKLRKLG